MSVLLLASDLMAASKIVAAGQRASQKVDFAMSVEALLERAAATTPTGVILDLSVPGLDLPPLIAQLRGGPKPPTIVAFAPHVHATLLSVHSRFGLHAR